MSLRFRVLVLRLLLAIYKHQLASLRIKPTYGVRLVSETETFIQEFIQEENEDRRK